MNTNFIRLYFAALGDFRFNPSLCRTAGLKVAEAKFLKALLMGKRDNRWVQQNFGMGLAYNLMQRGLVENPLGEIRDEHTNLWQLTVRGADALVSAAGITEKIQ